MYKSLFDQTFFNRLSHFCLSPRLRPTSGLAGRYRSGKKGSSVEFSDIREYMPGDDIRRIDWNAYARTDRLFVKLYDDEREARYHILLDTSASMAVPKEKSIHALHIAASIAYMALNSGDRVDITFLHKDANKTTASFAGKTAIYTLAGLLSECTFSGGGVLPYSLEMLPYKSKGTTFIISDFLDLCGTPTAQGKDTSLFFSETYQVSEQQQVKHMLNLLAARRQSVALVQVYSQEEEQPERLFSEETAGNVFQLTDSETAGKLRLSPSKELFRHYHKQKQALESVLKSTAARYHGAYLKTVAGDPIEKFLQDGAHLDLWR